MWSTSTSFTLIHITNGVIAAATGAIFCWPVPGSKIVLCSEEGSEKRVGAGEREGGFFHFCRLRSPFLDHARPIFPWPCFRDVPSPLLVPVVQTLDSAVHRINHYPTVRQWRCLKWSIVILTPYHCCTTTSLFLLRGMSASASGRLYVVCNSDLLIFFSILL